MREPSDGEEETQMKQVDEENKEMQTDNEVELFICKKVVSKNELIMEDDKIICLFKRVECSEEECEEVENTVLDSGIDLKGMLDEWAKVMEGYQRVELQKKKNMGFKD